MFFILEVSIVYKVMPLNFSYFPPNDINNFQNTLPDLPFSYQNLPVSFSTIGAPQSSVASMQFFSQQLLTNNSNPFVSMPLASTDSPVNLLSLYSLDSAPRQKSSPRNLLPQVDILTPDDSSDVLEKQSTKRLREGDISEPSPTFNSNDRAAKRSRLPNSKVANSNPSSYAPSETPRIEQKVEQLFKDVNQLKNENQTLQQEVLNLKSTVKKLNSCINGNKRSSGRGSKKK